MKSIDSVNMPARAKKGTCRLTRFNQEGKIIRSFGASNINDYTEVMQRSFERFNEFKCSLVLFISERQWGMPSYWRLKKEHRRVSSMIGGKPVSMLHDSCRLGLMSLNAPPRALKAQKCWHLKSRAISGTRRKLISSSGLPLKVLNRNIRSPRRWRRLRERRHSITTMSIKKVELNRLVKADWPKNKPLPKKS